MCSVKKLKNIMKTARREKTEKIKISILRFIFLFFTNPDRSIISIINIENTIGGEVSTLAFNAGD